jgi:tRNA (guanine-N7-)-methyltransferase
LNLPERRSRTVHSYVLRQGRLTTGQERAIKLHWHRYGISFSREPVNLDGVFGRISPKILEIGSGMGEAVAALAEVRPENDYLAVEVHKPGVGSLIRLAASRNLGNIRVIQYDIADILRYQLPQHCLDAVYIFFPDPWPKKRHHKRRLINPDFLALLLPKLKSHGRIFVLTDLQDMAEHVLTVCDNNEGLVNLAGSGHYSPRPGWLPITKFENRAMKLGHSVWSLAYGINFSELN